MFFYVLCFYCYCITLPLINQQQGGKIIFLFRNTAQENVMNAHGEFVYSMLWLIKPKNITTISTMQIII
jgi:hypothetical protein